MSRSLLLSCERVSKAYGARSLFDDLTLGLFEGDQAGLVGPNGSGKSTLLKILAGLIPPDAGSRSLRAGIRVGYVPQDPAFEPDRTIEDVVLAAVADLDPADQPGHVAQALGRAGFTDAQVPVEALSGGWKKRLAIARALAAGPDVVLMDEPTNHLDVDGILWLEDLLRERTRACLVVSHDRYFLEHVATRMLELDRAYPAGVFETDGTYSDFLARRDEFLRGQAAYQASLANTVRREIEWLRRGAKARSTKAKGRIEEAGRLIDELAEARARTASRSVGIDFTASQRRTRRLLVARGLVKSVGGRRLIDGLDLVITPGTRIGVLGPNGSGKTTLLSLLAGTLPPDAGEVQHADGLRIVRFEQERGDFDPAQSLRRALAPEGDAVAYQGRSLHVGAWATRFAFRPEQLDVPVGRLSGGEQARIRIAALMREPADVLMLDEPTNDLDIPTLEVLEDSLADFDGGLLLVTHDRFMLERVSTVILALDGTGRVETFADYTQWESARRASAAAPRAAAARAPARERGRPKRLGYLEQREWDGMEQAIMQAEQALEARRLEAEDPAIASNPTALQERYAAVDAARRDVDRLYARWAELEAKQA
ncbi:MAG TPA: ABC-F family ATP-binding cassette domain-containing protein [Methylomirabilota bacterium]|nr:ABC-F family ATP-binding cassette domain-containing protein [Methylomirabilota bacterium]